MRKKLAIYEDLTRVYHSVRPLVWIGTPHPLSPSDCVSPPWTKGGENTLACGLRVRGWGSLNSDYWRKSLALCLHFESLAARSTLSCREHIYLCDTITVFPVPNQTVCTRIYIACNYVSMWNMYNRMKPPYFSLNIGLFFFLFISDPDSNPDPKSGSETGSEMFISVPDRIRIRPKVSDPYGSGSGSGSGSATLLTPVNFLNFSKKAQKRSYCSKNVFVIKI